MWLSYVETNSGSTHWQQNCDNMAKKPFSIDDAFDENLDDVVVRVYGSTTVEKSAFSTRNNSGVKPVPNIEGIARKWKVLYQTFHKMCTPRSMLE